MRRRLVPSLLVALAAVVAGCTSGTQPDAGGGNAAGTAPAPTGGTLKLGMMPKQKGIPYFNACEKGAREAAQELGDVDLVYEGPIEDRSEKQSEMLDTWITTGFNAVAVACNDKDQISPTLARARDEGLTVITWDADADPVASRRQFFVNQVGVNEIAEALLEEMVRQTGPDAEVAVVSSSSTAPNQSAWLAKMEEIRAKKYPNLKFVATEYAGENQVVSEQKAESLLKAHPSLKGLYGMTSVAFPGAASAVKKAGKAGKVAVVGLGTPNDMKPFVKEGVVKSVVLWNPVDLGYLTVYVARAVAKGELKPGDTSFRAGRLGELQVKDSEVLLGKPMVFTAENIDEFDF